MKPIKKIKTSNIVVVISIMLFVAAACAMLAHNAFATEDTSPVAADQAPAIEPEASADPAISNDSHQISFKFKNAPADVNPEYCLTINDISRPYTLGEKVTVEETTPLYYWSYMGVCSANVTFAEKEESNDFDYTAVNFNVRAPAGYQITDVTPEGGDFDSDLVFEFTFAQYTGNYNLTINAKQGEEGPAIDGYHITLYDLDWNEIKSADTVGGTATFTLTKNEVNCHVTGSKEGYSDFTKKLASYMYDENFSFAENMYVCPESQADTQYTSNDEFHDFFIYDLKALRYNLPSYVDGAFYLKKSQICLSDEAMVGYEFKVIKEDGTVSLKIEVAELDAVFDYKVTPVGKEGYTLHHWVLDRGHNATEDIYPGGSFTLQVGDIMKLEAVYTEAPQPGPEPTPSPTPAPSPEVTAQTGDSTPLIPFVLLAILASGVLLYTRFIKASRSQNNDLY